MEIGKGKIKKKGKRFVYEGNFPNVGEDVEIAVIRLEDLEALIRGQENALLQTKFDMDKLFDYFPDEMTYEASNTTKHKLFLDRHFYSRNPKDMVWLRYVSVDQSFIEENSQNG